MKSQKRIIIFITIALLFFSGLVLLSAANSYVLHEADRTYIIDRNGEKWDITQAKALGFEPRHFRFGLGRHAFSPLDKSHWQSGKFGGPSNLRVIGVSEGKYAHAYSVQKLSHHETANTMLGNKAIVAAY
ncbi:MAG: hypothetical protein R6U27_17645 [Desulfobacterales bacterium]